MKIFLHVLGIVPKLTNSKAVKEKFMGLSQLVVRSSTLMKPRPFEKPYLDYLSSQGSPSLSWALPPRRNLCSFWKCISIISCIISYPVLVLMLSNLEDFWAFIFWEKPIMSKREPIRNSLSSRRSTFRRMWQHEW